jgi:hypothetical protein
MNVVDVFSTCVNMEHWNLSRSFLEMECRKRENNRGDESSQGTMYAYVEMSHQNPCTTIIKIFFKWKIKDKVKEV